MAEVFISYSSADKSAADAVCAALEADGTSCWIAPRDIVAGSYAAAIIRGIRASKMLVLIFSSHSNKSPQVEREIERAVSLNKVIYPLRIENILPSERLELFISAEQWMDAFEPPLEDHLARFSHNVKELLSGVETPPPPEPKISPIWTIAATILCVFALIVLVNTITALQAGGMNGMTIAGIAMQSFLLLFAGAAFLPSGRRSLAKLVAGPNWKGAPRLWLALAVLVLTIGLRLLLPDIIARYLNRKGDQAFSDKQFAAAVLNYQHAVALKPSLTKARLSLAKAHFDLALESDKTHDYANAITEYERCILADGKNYAAHNNLARLLILQRKEYNEALRHLNYLLQDLAVLPVQIQYFLFKNLGWANLELHNYSLAEQQLEWALIKRNGAAAHYLLGRVFAEQGRKIEAKQQWDSFIQSMQNGAAAEEQVESDWMAYAQEQLTKGG